MGDAHTKHAYVTNDSEFVVRAQSYDGADCAKTRCRDDYYLQPGEVRRELSGMDMSGGPALIVRLSRGQLERTHNCWSDEQVVVSGWMPEVRKVRLLVWNRTRSALDVRVSSDAFPNGGRMDVAWTQTLTMMPGLYLTSEDATTLNERLASNSALNCAYALDLPGGNVSHTIHVYQPGSEDVVACRTLDTTSIVEIVSDSRSPGVVTFNVVANDRPRLVSSFYDLENKHVEETQPEVVHEVTYKNDTSIEQPVGPYLYETGKSKTVRFERQHGYEVKVGLAFEWGVPEVCKKRISIDVSHSSNWTFGEDNTTSSVRKEEFSYRAPPKTVLEVTALRNNLLLVVPFTQTWLIDARLQTVHGVLRSKTQKYEVVVSDAPLPDCRRAGA